MDRESKTETVKRFILNEINAEKIKSGERLPSCREIAGKLSVNKLTVNKAYHELENEHKVFGISRGGFYLVDSGEVSPGDRKQIDFSIVKPDDRLIPYREFAHAMNKAVDQYKHSLFGYDLTIGSLSLRETLKVIFQQDGVYTTSDRILITNGSQQAISLVFQFVFRNRKGKLLVEVPTYGLALEFADYLGIAVIGIERKPDGYDYKNMERIFREENIAAFYVMPRHHNPTGYSLSENDKKRIADLAGKYKICIIEDDYLADVGDKKGSMPIHYYEIEKCSVYIRSFSKTFMPGIRIGAVVLPATMVETVAKLKHLWDLNTSRLPQAALEIFIKSGMYEKHVKKMRKSYEAKLRKAEKIFQDLSPQELDWHVPKHGIFIWIQLPGYINITSLLQMLEKQAILIKPASDFFLRQENDQQDYARHKNCVRLCISGIPEEDMGSLAVLLSAIRKFKQLESDR